MSSFYSAKWGKIFYYILVTIVTYAEGIYAQQWWHTQKLEILHLKLQKHSEKYENIKSTYFIPWRIQI